MWEFHVFSWERTTRNFPNLWNTEYIFFCSCNFKFVTLPFNLPLNTTLLCDEKKFGLFRELNKQKKESQGYKSRENNVHFTNSCHQDTLCVGDSVKVFLCLKSHFAQAHRKQLDPKENGSIHEWNLYFCIPIWISRHFE